MAAKNEITKEQLVQAAKLRDEGATWNAIREATGTKLSSSAWFRAWEAEKINHRPAGTPKAASGDKERRAAANKLLRESKAAKAPKPPAKAAPKPKAAATPKRRKVAPKTTDEARTSA